MGSVTWSQHHVSAVGSGRLPGVEVAARIGGEQDGGACGAFAGAVCLRRYLVVGAAWARSLLAAAAAECVDPHRGPGDGALEDLLVGRVDAEAG
jgi:hypothetical protein